MRRIELTFTFLRPVEYYQVKLHSTSLYYGPLWGRKTGVGGIYNFVPACFTFLPNSSDIFRDMAGKVSSCLQDTRDPHKVQDHDQ
jgi:hypothetical protein